MAAISLATAIVSLLVLVGGVTSLHVKFIPCEKTAVEAASVVFLDVTPCSAFPCKLQAGKTYQLSVSFETGATPESVPAIKTNLYAIIEHVKVIFPNFTRTDACVDSNLSCPLAPSRAYEFSIPVTVPSPVIPMEPMVELELVDEKTKKDLLCVETEIIIVT